MYDEDRNTMKEESRLKAQELGHVMGAWKDHSSFYSECYCGLCGAQIEVCSLPALRKANGSALVEECSSKDDGEVTAKRYCISYNTISYDVELIAGGLCIIENLETGEEILSNNKLYDILRAVAIRKDKECS